VLILVEAQSTWSVNILVRLLLYAAETIQRHILKTRQNVYGSRRVEIPKLKFYVIYTGDQKERPEELVLSKEFFDGDACSVDVWVKMIYDGKQGDIINQYVTFTKVYQEQYGKYGRQKKKIMETIRICGERNILKEYLEERKQEIIDIMMTLFDQRTVLDLYTKEIRDEGREEGMERGREEGMEEGKVVGIVEMCKEFGLDLVQTIIRVKKAMPSLSPQDAEAQVKAIW